MAIDGVLVPITFFGMVAIVTVGMPLARAYARRMESGATRPTVPPDVTARLERMEQAIDSIAIEIERISEGQRFTTKLLSDRVVGSPPAPPPVAIPGTIMTHREG
ncbi:MAG: hypothetical protein M3Z10_11635 [Gemmatimonadota bacterium]|nr:hypothetical protein [Gemmatimonadota bacterium]